VNGPAVQGFLIPLYNHGATIRDMASRLAPYKRPVIIVDDGSDEAARRALSETAAAFSCVTAVRRERNGGKGAAVMTGLGKARDMGLSHVLQIDADGQHDADRAGFFLEASAARPEAAICGFPEYAGAPALRAKGRNIANTWTKIVTRSPDIVDSLCGFRVYPVEQTLAVIGLRHLDKRMGFDPEILVRLHWAGIPFLFHPVRVDYPQDGLSHFRMVEDNVRISWVYTRLFFGMIPRLPALLCRAARRNRAARKAAAGESGTT
jgi:glycosyltransferase involved in cell wall biosynthesis